MEIDTQKFCVYPKEKRIRKFYSLANVFLNSQTTFKQLEILLGLMASMIYLIPKSHLRMRPLQFALIEAKRKQTRDQDLVIMGEECLSCIQRWIQNDRPRKGMEISVKTPSISMETDASLIGWGARVDTSLAKGLWSPLEKLLHINVLELKAILKGRKAHAHLLKTKVVALLGDNATALAYVKHGGGTRSRECFQGSEEGPSVSGVPEYNLSTSFHPGCSKCGRGFTLSTDGKQVHGMVSKYEDLPGALESMGSTRNRCFRNLPKQENKEILFTCTRSEGRGNRCFSPKLERKVHIHVSTDKAHKEGIGKIQGVSSLPGDPNSSSMATTTLVSRPRRAVR